VKFVLIFGPQAVGKMTVGQQLAKITDLKLFHNHMTIDLVSTFFDYGTTEGKRLVELFRNEIFEAVSKSDLDGIIFTYVWAFDMKEDWNYVNHVCELFESRGGTIYFVELEAQIEERIIRNKSPQRLEHKPTKRDIVWSENNLKTSMERYRLNSWPGEINQSNYLRINNTNISAEEAAKRIQERFNL